MRRSTPLTVAAVALAVVYAGLAVALPADGFVSTGEGIVALQTEAIVRQGWLGLALPPTGGALDPGARFVPEGLRRTGGDLRPAEPSILPLVSSLPRALLGTRGLWVVPALCALLGLLAASRVARGVLPEPQRRDPFWVGLAGLAVAATPIVWMGAGIGPATLAALLVLWALLPLLPPLAGAGRRDDVASGFISGLALGGAAAAEAGALLMAPALIAGGAIARGAGRFTRTGVAIACGVTAVLLPRALLHRVLYGDPFPARLGTGPVDWGRAAATLLTLLTVALLAMALVHFARRRLATGTRAAAGMVLCAVLLSTGPLLASGDLAGFLPLLSLLPLAALLPERGGGEPARLIGWTAGIFFLLAAALAPAAAIEASSARFAPAAGLLAVAMTAAAAARRSSPAGRAVTVCLAAALLVGVAGQIAALRSLAADREAAGARVATIRARLPEDPVIVAASPDAAGLAAALSREAPVLALRRLADAGRVAAALESANEAPVWIASKRSPVGDPALASTLQRDLEVAVALADGTTLQVFGRPDSARAYLRLPRGD